MSEKSLDILGPDQSLILHGKHARIRAHTEAAVFVTISRSFVAEHHLRHNFEVYQQPSSADIEREISRVVGA